MRVQAMENLLKLFLSTYDEKELEELRRKTRLVLDRSVNSSEIMKEVNCARSSTGKSKELLPPVLRVRVLPCAP